MPRNTDTSSQQQPVEQQPVEQEQKSTMNGYYVGAALSTMGFFCHLLGSGATNQCMSDQEAAQPWIKEYSPERDKVEADCAESNSGYFTAANLFIFAAIASCAVELFRQSAAEEKRRPQPAAGDSTATTLLRPKDPKGSYGMRKDDLESAQTSSIPE